MIKRRSFLKPSSLPRRSPKRVNRKRKAREFARAYHSGERVLFVKGLPCCACGVVGYSENAHSVGGGTSRKADYTAILPLCGPKSVFLVGCHRVLHDLGRVTFEKEYGIDLGVEAARTQTKWLAHEAA